MDAGSELVRTRVSELLAAGALGVEVVNAIFDGSECAPFEGYLFDYKAKWPSSKVELRKLVRHVTAFHNVFGGYLFFGVEEVEKETLFLPVLESDPKPDIKQLRDILRDHLSTPIEVTLRTHEIRLSGGALRYLCVLHIPKRSHESEPISVVRGATDDKSKSILDEGSVYLRDADNSVPASSPRHWKTVYGIRSNPYQMLPLPSAVALESNLPDRSLIYREFVGRAEELEQLWRWFSDDFSRVRVLAGEGGLGKTSIAYEFASDVGRTAPLSFESVVWLTAKKRQFRALQNSFDELGLEVFESTNEMLRQMGAKLGLTDAEVTDTPDTQLARLVRNAAARITALVVIDDLDSLDLDEQKRAIEICQQFSGSRSRFLFTTRNNVTASSASSIEIRGFDRDELARFAASWCERLNLAQLSGAELRSLQDATGGSPLFVESVLRLLKAGIPFGEGLKQWKGHLGVEVRNAALKREVMQLRLEARKMLVIIATLGSCSFAEVKSLLGFSDLTVLDAASGLQTLFLIHSPPIAKTPRYAISSTTRQLVQSLGTEFLPEFNDLVKDVRRRKYKSVADDKAPPQRSVAAAINQAMAQMAEENFDDAVKTVEEVNQRLGGSNPDLLSVRARALASIASVPPASIRKAFEAAYDAGQRKDVFFDHWFKAEVSATNFDGAIEVADRAIQSEAGTPVYWLTKRLEARRLAATRHASGDPEHAGTQVRAGYADIRRLKEEADRDDDPLSVETAERYLEMFADLDWQISRPSGDLARWLDAVERQVEAIELGDERSDTYLRAAAALVGLYKAVPSGSESARTVFEKQLRQVLSRYKTAPAYVARDAKFRGAYSDLQALSRS